MSVDVPVSNRYIFNVHQRTFHYVACTNFYDTLFTPFCAEARHTKWLPVRETHRDLKSNRQYYAIS